MLVVIDVSMQHWIEKIVGMLQQRNNFLSLLILVYYFVILNKNAQTQNHRE